MKDAFGRAVPGKRAVMANAAAEVAVTGTVALVSVAMVVAVPLRINTVVMAYVPAAAVANRKPGTGT